AVSWRSANHQGLAVETGRVDVLDRLFLPAFFAHKRHFDGHGFECLETEVERDGALAVVAAAGRYLARPEHLARHAVEPYFRAEAGPVLFRIEHRHFQAAPLHGFGERVAEQEVAALRRVAASHAQI